MAGLNSLAQQIHQTAVDHGFWEGPRNFGEMVALMHSELSEALEEHRAGRPGEWFQINGVRVYPVTDGSGADWTTDPLGYSSPGATWTGVQAKPEGVAVELADCLIRILDTLAHLGVDVDGVVARKMAHNASRPYLHGKAY
jgi:hypothetical protein